MFEKRPDLLNNTNRTGIEIATTVHACDLIVLFLSGTLVWLARILFVSVATALGINNEEQRARWRLWNWPSVGRKRTRIQRKNCVYVCVEKARAVVGSWPWTATRPKLPPRARVCVFVFSVWFNDRRCLSNTHPEMFTVYFKNNKYFVMNKFKKNTTCVGLQQYMFALHRS